jgi:hypothetical protein
MNSKEQLAFGAIDYDSRSGRVGASNAMAMIERF